MKGFGRMAFCLTQSNLSSSNNKNTKVNLTCELFKKTSLGKGGGEGVK